MAILQAIPCRSTTPQYQGKSIALSRSLLFLAPEQLSKASSCGHKRASRVSRIVSRRTYFSSGLFHAAVAEAVRQPLSVNACMHPIDGYQVEDGRSVAPIVRYLSFGAQVGRNLVPVVLVQGDPGCGESQVPPARLRL